MAKIIDFHVHPNTEEYVQSGGKYLQHAAEYFNHQWNLQTVEEIAEEYKSMDMIGVLLAWDAQTNTGLPTVSNDYIAGIVHKYPDTFIGFASVDPWKGKVAIEELKRAILHLGLKGLKLHQTAQGFYPNDKRFYPLWETCIDLKIPVQFHMGVTGFGGGVPGGDGLLIDYCRPIYIDEVAARFPELTIIGAHPAWPWHDEMLAVAMHKGNVYMDLSGWSPKYFPQSIIQYANSLLQNKFVFGSDAPFIKPHRWLEDFGKAPFKEGVRDKILYENAKKILGLKD